MNKERKKILDKEINVTKRGKEMEKKKLKK